MYQLVLLWEAAFCFSELFFEDSTCLPISWWVICELTCPHCAECSKQHDRQVLPSLSPDLIPSNFFFVFLMKTLLRGNCFADVDEAKQNMAEKWVDPKTMVYLHNGILCSREKEGAYTLCDIMDETGEHYAKWNKPGSEGQIPYDLTFKWNIINRRKKETKYNKRHWN